MPSNAASSSPRGSRRFGAVLARFTGFAVGFAVGGWVVLGTLDEIGQRYGHVELDVTTSLQRALEAEAAYRGPGRIVFLGDSLSWDVKGRAAPTELRRRLRRLRRDTPPLLNVSLPGLTVFSHYLASDALTRLGADRFIVAVNLGWFSRADTAQQPSLASMLPPNRWPEAASLPLNVIGLSGDEVVSARLVATAGLLETWHALQREQLRVRYAIARLGRWLQAAVGAPSGSDYAREITRYRGARRVVDHRPTEEGARRRLGPVLRGLPPDDPNLMMLAALVSRLRASGARVLVVVLPTNVDRLVDLGLYDEPGISVSLSRIHDVARDRGADFLDLHALLPDAAFRDEADHLAFDAPMRPAAQIAERLVPWSLDATHAGAADDSHPRRGASMTH